MIREVDAVEGEKWRKVLPLVMDGLDGYVGWNFEASSELMYTK